MSFGKKKLLNQQRILLIEGPDNNGKTHIGQKLSQMLEIPYFKNTDEWGAFLKKPEYFVNTLNYAEPFFLNYLKQTKASIILDRSYPSEWVYSKAFNRKTDMHQLQRVDEAYAELGAKIIICHRTDYTNQVDELFPEQIDSSKLVDIDELYNQFAVWTKCKLLRLNVDDENMSREIADINTFLDMVNKNAEENKK
jgi:hypothetical protein